MLLVREGLQRSCPPGEHAVTIGVFDGVHIGHRMLIDRMLEEAGTRGLSGGVLTFHPSPIKVLRPDVPFAYIESLEQRVEHLREAGALFTAVIDFTSELTQVSAADFCQLLYEAAGMRLLVVGEDFALGRGREGDVARLRELGAEIGFEAIGVPLLRPSADLVSSTRIRALLATGAMETVQALLGRPFSMRGPVVRGEERGRTIGFPTLNIGVSADLALPANGVYITSALLRDGRRFQAVTNIGERPTFEGEQRRVETHLLDFEGDLYGEVVTIELLSRVRDEQKFDGVEALVAQIAMDVDSTRRLFAGRRGDGDV